MNNHDFRSPGSDHIPPERISLFADGSVRLITKFYRSEHTLHCWAVWLTRSPWRCPINDHTEPARETE